MNINNEKAPELLVGRRITGSGYYELGSLDGKFDKVGGFTRGYIVNFCPEDFHKYTGLSLRKGEGPKKIRIKFEEVTHV